MKSVDLAEMVREDTIAGNGQPRTDNRQRAGEDQNADRGTTCGRERQHAGSETAKRASPTIAAVSTRRVYEGHRQAVRPSLPMGDTRGVKLYVCYGTFGSVERHACGRAHHALVEAGHRPEVERTYGCFGTDPVFRGRREIKEMTGNYKVPTLVLDDGSVIDGSRNIAAWASANSAWAASGRARALA